MRIEGQKVSISKKDPNHNQLAAEFFHILGGDTSSDRELRIIDLLAQIPGIHRALCKIEKCTPKFLPIYRFKLFHNHSQVWCRVVLEKSDRDVTLTLPALRKSRRFQRHLTQVAAATQDELWFETTLVGGSYRKGIDNALQQLAKSLREIGIWAILTPSGYRYYFSTLEPRKTLPPLAAVYSTIFYFGSITRYRPQDYTRILGGGYSWVLGEFFATQPTQFLYSLASFLAGTEVIHPHIQTI